jgi:hypothetical protein
MRMRTTLFAGALALLAARPPGAHAQTEVAPPAGDSGGCTISCGCTQLMCGCSRTGGSGGACKSDGNTCAVFACPGAMLLLRGATFAMAADGSIIAAQPTDANGPAFTPARAVRWRNVGTGHAVGLDCGGAVVAEYFDARTAAAARRESQRLTI